MKKTYLVALAGILFFTACDNSGSSTIGSYKDEETSPAIDKNNEIEKGPDSLKNSKGEIADSTSSQNKKEQEH